MHAARAWCRLKRTDKDSSTPLLATVKYENIEVVRALLDNDANVGAEDEEGRSPLHQATSSGSTELVRTLLLEHGADINARTKDSSTLLLVATKHWNIEVMPALLEHGAYVGMENKEGRTPL